MFMRRRRPLMRAAMVGGGAYYAGKKIQQGRQQDAEQDARIQDLDAAPAAPAGGISETTIDQQKQKLLQTT